jgi:hypothetical protein
MRTSNAWGLCPTCPEHGRLLDNAERYICPHAGHNERQHDDNPAMRQNAWSLDELRALGAMP